MTKLIAFLLLISIFSCSNSNDKKPKNFIEKDTMVDLIVAMKIAEKAQTIPNKDKKKNQKYMTVVFEKYHIDSMQFKNSSDYYTERLEVYHDIYKSVQKRLKDSLHKYETLKKEEDSIQKLKKKNLKLDKSLKKNPSN